MECYNASITFAAVCSARVVLTGQGLSVSWSIEPPPGGGMWNSLHRSPQEYFRSGGEG